MPLDDTISTGQSGHITDHQTIATTLNALATTYVALAGGSASRITGDLYFANAKALYFRNAAGSAEVQCISVTNGDDVVVGNTAGQDVLILTGGAADIALDPQGTGIVSTSKSIRVGSLTGGTPTEKLTVIGHASIEPGTVPSYLRFISTGTGAKNWRVGTGFITAGRFEIQDTSDSASAYLSIDPTAGDIRIGKLFSSSEVLATQLTVGTGTDNGSTKWLVNSSGQPRWVDAGNIQTTVGAAGGASALPATPTKYFKVLDASGNPFVFPVYAAA